MPSFRKQIHPRRISVPRRIANQSDSCVFFLLLSSTPLLKIATAFPRQANYLVLAIHFGATCFEPMPFGLSVDRIESPPSNDQTELNTTQVPNFSGEKNI